MVSPAARPLSAAGLTAIQAISLAGKASSAAGWAQYELTDRVAAQPNAATPPGARPWCGQAWPPVPGQPLAMCRPPMTSTAALTTVSGAGPGQAAAGPGE